MADLSFNNITKIEGLDSLTKLTDLTLFNNRISVIEGLDDLVNLNVFSIGNNNITAIDGLAYLVKFEQLKVLNATGNAVCKNANYKHYCLAHFKSLKYLDYRLIEADAVALGREKYVDSIIALEEEEKAATNRKENIKKKSELDMLQNVTVILTVRKHTF